MNEIEVGSLAMSYIVRGFFAAFFVSVVGVAFRAVMSFFREFVK